MRVAVVGGGISGLTAAYRLRTALGPSAEITVLESGDRLGGKLHTVSLGGYALDVGAEAFLVRRPEMTTLAAELGLPVVHPSGVPASIRAGGRTVPLPRGTVMGVPVGPEAVAGVLSADAVRRVAEEPSLPPVRLGDRDITVGALLRERFGSELVERLVDPLLGGVYAGSADRLGLRATLPMIAAQLDRGVPSLSEAAAGASGAAQSRQVAGDAAVFGTVPGGLSAVVAALAPAARIRCGTTVVGLERLGGTWRVQVGDGDFLDVDAVLLAVPAPAARRLLTGVVPEAAAALGQVELASMAVVAMVLPADVELPQTSGVLIGSAETWPDGRPFTAKAFTFSSRKWAHLGGVLVRGSVGRFGEEALLRRPDAELLAAVRADLRELTGITAEPLAARVIRWGGGLPQYGVGHLDLVARIEAAVAEHPGLALAGAALHGVGLPACVATATAAARLVVGNTLV